MTFPEEFCVLLNQGSPVRLQIFWFLVVGCVNVDVKQYRQTFNALLRRECGWVRYKTVSERKTLLTTALWNSVWDIRLPLLWYEFDNQDT